MTASFANRSRVLSFQRLLCAVACAVALQTASAASSNSTQPHRLQKLKSPARLLVTNSYYAVEHDLSRGGAISRLRLAHGDGSLILGAATAQVADANGMIFSEMNDPKPRVSTSTFGQARIIDVEARLLNDRGVAVRNVTLKSRYEHRWGYIKIRKEFIIKRTGLQVTALTPFQAVFPAALDHYGYREGVTEEEQAGPFSFGSCRWGTLDSARPIGIHTNYLPRYVMCAEPSRQGIEWFMGSDLFQWDLQFGGRRGSGECLLNYLPDGRGISLEVSTLKSATPIAIPASRLVFDYYLGFPLKEGHALKPWLHTSFNRNRGEWVSPEQVRRWAESGIQTVHCHNDGDYYDDGLFWRDGSYPPYPDMERYDQVLANCRAAGIRTATYFSNKELHSSTKEFQEHGQEWGRKSLKGHLQHNMFRGTNEFGAQMCLRSGWLNFLKTSIGRVLQNHPLDGVYYDWNVALLCNNPLHEPKGRGSGSAAHWDIDELLQLMEWTRERVGPKGLVILHNTTTPMFAAENFADHIVANEWGYGKWSGAGPKLSELPLEWSLVGARSRGVISYGQLDAKSPRRLHRVFALQALVSGVTPWPASPETFELFPLLKPVGDLETCRFADWRNAAVTLNGERCASAVYSRPEESWLLIANYGETSQTITCKLDPTKLPFPLSVPRTLTLEAKSNSNQASAPENLNAATLLGSGIQLTLDPDSAVLLRVR